MQWIYDVQLTYPYLIKGPKSTDMYLLDPILLTILLHNRIPFGMQVPNAIIYCDFRYTFIMKHALIYTRWNMVEGLERIIVEGLWRHTVKWIIANDLCANIFSCWLDLLTEVYWIWACNFQTKRVHLSYVSLENTINDWSSYEKCFSFTDWNFKVVVLL